MRRGVQGDTVLASTAHAPGTSSTSSGVMDGEVCGVWLGGAHAGWMMEGALQKLVLVVTSVDTKETLERWTFDIQGEEQPAEGRCVPVQRRASSRIVNILGFGTGRQKMALDRWTKTTLLGRTCSPRHGLQSCRGKSAPRPPTETRMCDSPLFPPLNPKDGGRGWL